MICVSNIFAFVLKFWKSFELELICLFFFGYTLATLAAKKSILIGVTLVLVQEFCGAFAMINYTATIFAESGSNISPNLSAIIVGFIQLMGTIAATQLIDRAGRKVNWFQFF